MFFSASQQSRGMAMVLGNAMLDRGVSVQVLLCDSAGDMALEGHDSETLAPRDVTPEQLPGRLPCICLIVSMASVTCETVWAWLSPEHMMNSKTRVFIF